MLSRSLSFQEARFSSSLAWCDDLRAITTSGACPKYASPSRFDGNTFHHIPTSSSSQQTNKHPLERIPLGPLAKLPHKPPRRLPRLRPRHNPQPHSDDRPSPSVHSQPAIDEVLIIFELVKECST